MLDGLRKLGAFGMKIPKEYGGLGFTNAEYQQGDGAARQLRRQHLGAALGAPVDRRAAAAQALRHRRAEEEVPAALRRGRDLGLRAHRADVGSDPARLATTAELTADGDAYVLNGEKLWCTNGTLAELLVVMARDPKTKKISAFVVETDWPGVKVEHRCHFMGLKALANGVISFNDVRVPRENLIGDEGKGLKIALTTLNTGRLSIPSGSVGIAKLCLEICRSWARERVQWGVPIGKHEAIAHKIADMAATTFAMECGRRSGDRDGRPRRLRHPPRGGGGQGVEHRPRLGDRRRHDADPRRPRLRDRALARRRAARRRSPVERMMRDYRINLIFEGSSEIMHLFMAREAVDKHLQVAGAMIDPEEGAGEKLAGAAEDRSPSTPAGTRAAGWAGAGGRATPSSGALAGAPALRRAQHAASWRAQIFHGMVVYQAQAGAQAGFLFRCVDIAKELFAMAAVGVARASADATRRRRGRPAGARQLADLFCRNARRKVRRLFRDLWRNDDARKYAVGKARARRRAPVAREAARRAPRAGAGAASARAGGSAYAGEDPAARRRPGGGYRLGGDGATPERQSAAPALTRAASRERREGPNAACARSAWAGRAAVSTRYFELPAKTPLTVACSTTPLSKKYLALAV